MRLLYFPKKKKKSNCKYSQTFFAVYSKPFVSRLINFSHASAALPWQTGFNLIEKFKIKYTNRARPVKNHSMMATGWEEWSN